jgi:hypothetical protein
MRGKGDTNYKVRYKGKTKLKYKGALQNVKIGANHEKNKMIL